MAKRVIPEEQYQKERELNPNALDYPQVLDQGLILDLQHTDWVVVQNKYPFVEYDDKNVISHYLIVDKRNDIESISDLDQHDLNDLQDIINELKNKVSKEYNFNVVWKEVGSSLRKFHIHIIITER
jgi:diadenosine tetraphosphate (Ap4A) HIT family hydrolase